MPDIIKLDASDIINLGPLALVELLHILVVRELRSHGLSAAGAETSLAINIPDGGLDSRAKWEGGPDQTAFLPSRHVGFQSKSGPITPGRMAKDLLRSDESDLKSEVRRLIEEGGTYILFYGRPSGLGGTDGLRDAIAATIRSKMALHDVRVDVYDASKIAAWASSHVATFVWVAALTGRPLPRTTVTYGEWCNEGIHQHAFVSNPRIDAFLEELRHRLGSEGNAARIDGLPGHGKSRLAIEALRPLEEFGKGVVYIDAGFAEHAEIVDAILGWRRMDATGVVVVDNCADRLHNRLSEIVSGSRLDVLTIDYGLAEMGAVPVIRLDRSEDQIINGILVDAYRDRLLPSDLARIVDFAFGSPRMARLLADSHLDTIPTPLHRLTDDDLLRRLLFGRSNPMESAEKVARGLSLFEHVGCDGAVKGQLDYVGRKFCPGVDEAAFAMAVSRYEERGILVRVGDYFRMSPPPMAVRLAKTWLDYSTVDMRQLLFAEDMPPTLVEMLCRQFRYLGTVARAAEIVSELCKPDAPFGTAEVLKTKRGARIFRSLAEVNREVCAATLTREFGRATREDLLSVNEGRREIVFALEKLIFNQHLFMEAGRVLVAFADAENENVSNNATGVLVSKYSPWLGGTEAPPELRFRLLDEFAPRSENHGLIAIRCISAALQTAHAHRVVGAEYQGGRPPLEDWHPKTSDELVDYLSGAVARLIKIFGRGGRLAEAARKALAHSIRPLVGNGRVSDIQGAVESMRSSGELWTDAIDSLRAAQKFEARGNPELREAIAKVLAVIEPHDLPSRIRLTVTEAPPDFEQTDAGGLVDLTAQRISELAHEIISRGELESAIALVVEGDQVRGFDFGQALAEISQDVGALLSTIAESLGAADPDRMNPSVLGGALSTAKRRSLAAYERSIETAIADSRLRPITPWLIATSRPTDRDIERLITVARNNGIEPTKFRYLAWGGALDAISEGLVFRFLSTLVDAGGAETVVQIANMHIFANATRWSILAPLLERAFTEWDFVATKRTSIEEHSVVDTLKRLLAEDGRTNLASTTTNRLLEYVRQPEIDYSDRARAAQVWPLLLDHYPTTVWPIVLEKWGKATPGDRMRILFSFDYIPVGATQHEFSLLRLPHEYLLEWCNKYSDFVPAYLAQKVPLYTVEGNSVHPTTIAKTLLARFGMRRDVLSSVYANLYSFGSVGSRAPYYQERLSFIDSLPDFDHHEIATWRAEVRQALIEAIAESRRRDEEFQGGIF